MNLQCFLLEAQSRERDRMNFAIEFALSIAPPIRNTAIPADLNSKSVITYNFVNSEQLFQFFDFYYTFVVSFKVHFLFWDFSIYMFDFRHCIFEPRISISLIEYALI